MRKYVIGIGFVLIFLVTILGYSHYQRSPYSVHALLNAYGFESVAQIKAIEGLFQKASIIPAGQPLDMAFPRRTTQEQFVNDVLTIVEKTQRQFVIRKDKQERWEVKPHQWMSEDKDLLVQNLNALGFLNEIKPPQSLIDVFCVLGATAPVMAKRLDYVSTLIDSEFLAKKIVLLTGARYVSKNIDGTEQELSKIAKMYNLKDWTKLTETHLFKALYEKSSLKNKSIPVHVIDTPGGDLPRPTMQTTLLEFLAWLKEYPDVQTVVFVSNQPYVAYQRAVIQAVLDGQGRKLDFKVIGPGVDEPQDTQAVIEGLGSYLWAATPTILSSRGIFYSNENLKNRLQELYGKNPLIYGALPEKLRF